MSNLKLWERQSYENDAQWQAFLYYRDMPLPRSVDGAYRQYYCQKYQLQHSDKSVIRKRAVGGWQNWSRGLKWTGRPQQDALTWEARAADYDLYQNRLLEDRLQEQLVAERMGLIQDELADYKLQLTKFREVWGRTALHERKVTGRTKEKRINEKGEGVEQEIEIVAVELEIKDWFELSRWRGLISEQGRRVLSMPATIVQNQLAGHTGGKLELLAVDDLLELFQSMSQWEREQYDRPPKT